MAAKEEKPLKISAVSVDKSLEDWKKVKALYKESFTSAQRAPFRSLMAQPEEGKSSLTAYLTDSRKIRLYEGRHHLHSVHHFQGLPERRGNRDFQPAS